MIPLALDFSVGTTAKVTYASAGINNVDPVTVLQWVYLPCATAGNCLLGINTDRWFDKGPNIFLVDGLSSSGDIQFQRNRATTNAVSNSNTGFILADCWQYWAFQYDSTASPTARIFVGDGNTPIREVTYASTTNGSGGNSDDSGTGLVVGNRSTDNRNIQGLISFIQIEAAALSVTEMRALQYRPRLTGRTRLFSYPASAGLGGHPIDLSGTTSAGVVVAARPMPFAVPRVDLRLAPWR